MSAIKRIIESLDDLDNMKVNLLSQGASPGDLLALEEHAAMLRTALGVA